MSSSAGIPRSPFERASPEEVLFLFGCCALMLFILVVCRTAINILIIDICFLGDCSAWRKLCCCYWWRRMRDQQERQNNSSTNNDAYEDDNDGNHHDFHDDDERARMNTSWRPYRLAGTIVDPVSYVYSSPKEMREKFLNTIIDSDILIPHQVVKVSSENQNDDVENEVQKNNFVEETMCSICLQDQEAGEACSRTKACSHIFHTHCIKTWIERSLQCPVCRKQLISNEKLLDCISAKRNIFTNPE